jgi:hypothetical protein
LHAATLDTTLATVKHINAGTQHQTTTAAVQVPTYAFNEQPILHAEWSTQHSLCQVLTPVLR